MVSSIFSQGRTKMTKYIVLEKNNLTSLTVNSIRSVDSDADIVCVDPGRSYFETALSNTNELALVLESGVVFRGDWSTMPMDMIERNPLSISQLYVFSDHPSFAQTYDTVGIRGTAGGIADTSVFIINPSLWVRTPEKDTGVLGYVKKAWMPRYMDHRNDPLVRAGLPAHACMVYNTLGVSAHVLNYVSCLENKDIEVSDTIAYPFDHLLPYVDGLDPNERDYVEHVGNKTKARIGAFRDGMATLNGLKNALTNSPAQNGV